MALDGPVDRRSVCLFVKGGIGSHVITPNK